MALERQVRAKMLAKRNPEQEREAQEWIESILGKKFPTGVAFEDVLKDGVVLCELMNKIKPGSINKINTSGSDFKLMENITKPNMTQHKPTQTYTHSPLLHISREVNEPNTAVSDFKLMENITKFQKALLDYGLSDVDVFQTVDLWEKKDIAQVITTLFALGRETYRHPEYTGPHLGPKPADKCERDFTEEQLKAGQTIVGLQAGSNKGANQAGQSMGASRKIILGK